jgi:hypothetical protein
LVAELARRCADSVHLPASSHCAVHTQQRMSDQVTAEWIDTVAYIYQQARLMIYVRLQALVPASLPGHPPPNVVSSFAFVSCDGMGSVTITFSTSPPLGVTTMVKVKTVPDSPLRGEAVLVIDRSLLSCPLITCNNTHRWRQAQMLSKTSALDAETSRFGNVACQPAQRQSQMRSTMYVIHAEQECCCISP